MFSKLDYVYAVYKEQSFTRAAEKLFISQPSLSAAIKKLEKMLGAPLFNRSGSAVTLTEVGLEYISAVEKIIKIREEFKSRVNDIYNLEVGRITVGGTNYLSSYVLPRIINRFAALYPKIEVNLVEAHSASLCEMIKSEEIDIVIDSFDESLEEYEGYPLAKERIFLCVPKDREINATLKEYSISPEDIYNGTVDVNKVKPININAFADESFVLLKKGNDMYNRAMRIFEDGGIFPNVTFNVDQLNISYALAESGIGLCFVTDTLFRFGNIGKNILLYNVSSELSNRMLYVAHKKNKYPSNAMRKFIEISKEVVGI